MICQIQNACRGFFSKTKSLKIILLTGSNNQFRNYESEFPHFFNQLEQLLQVFFVNISLIAIIFLKFRITNFKTGSWISWARLIIWKFPPEREQTHEEKNMLANQYMIKKIFEPQIIFQNSKFFQDLWM